MLDKPRGEYSAVRVNINTHGRKASVMASPLVDTPPMYRMRPYFEIKKVKLPDCMYTLKPLHVLTCLTPPSRQVGGVYML